MLDTFGERYVSYGYSLSGTGARCVDLLIELYGSALSLFQERKGKCSSISGKPQRTRYMQAHSIRLWAER